MKLSIGIVGLPNVGKSTLFKLLTKQEVNIANYPFATIDPNVGVVAVPDKRLAELASLSRSKKLIPAVVEFYDIAGLVKGANKGEGLGNQFLTHIRDVNAIVHVVRCFKDDLIIHVETDVNPIRDIETITMELILKDMETVKKRKDKLEGEARTGNKEKIKELELVERIEKGLNSGIPVSSIEGGDEPFIQSLTLLTSKPQLFLLNGDESDVTNELKAKINESKSFYVIVNLSQAQNLDSLVQKAYELLGLISFFTTGEDETRAWTIKEGIKAREAAGVIHTDFEKKFIRAEVINWQKLLDAKAWSTAKQKGWLRLEGKEYAVQDGDIVEIRHG